MLLADLLLLVGAGAVAGFLSGLLGIGGGVIFGPVLLFYFQGHGVAPESLTPLTAGTSLACTFAAALSGTIGHVKAGTIRPDVVLKAGGFAVLGVFLVTEFVTTQLWYDERVFQAVLGTLLVIVVVRMIRRQPPVAEAGEERATVPVLAASGSAAGAIAAAAGVGGGVVLVPAYNGIVRLPMMTASGTSVATIVLISLTGVVAYVIQGLGADVPATALGYVDWGRGLALELPAVATARLGVWAAQRIAVRKVRLAFAAFAALVAARLLWGAFGA